MLPEKTFVATFDTGTGYIDIQFKARMLHAPLKKQAAKMIRDQRDSSLHVYTYMPVIRVRESEFQ